VREKIVVVGHRGVPIGGHVHLTQVPIAVKVNVIRAGDPTAPSGVSWARLSEITEEKSF